MPLTLSCACGRQLRIADEHAGQRVQCPACGADTPPLPLPPGATATAAEPSGSPAAVGERTIDFAGPADPAAEAVPVRATAGLSFRVLRLLARGGLGEVFVARDEQLQREVALKEIQARHLDNAECRDRFLVEAEITGRLEHPGIVPVYGLGTHADGRPFYAMRLIQGESLQEALDRFHGPEGRGRPQQERSLELRQLLGRFVAVCNAVAYAHSKGVLHRDLKPANVMLGAFGETLVVDWGLAKVHGGPEAPAGGGEAGEGEGFTRAGQVLGTPAYMSPEQAGGEAEALGAASDVYGLGATLYALLTGKAPFQGREVRQVLRAVQDGQFPKPQAVQPGIPAALEAVCLKAMARRPEDRYATAKDLAADVERWLADEPTSAYREPWAQRLGRWVRRHQTKVVAAVVLLLTATVGLGVGGLLLSAAYQSEADARGRESEARGRELEASRKEAEASRKELEARGKEAEARRERTQAQVEQLRTADAGAVPALLEGLHPYRDEVLPRLRELWAQEDRGERQRPLRMRVGLALLAWEPEAVKGPLLDWMLETDDPRELELTRDRLASFGEEFRGRLWATAEDRAAPPAVRFRALVGLARFDPDGERWAAAAPGALEPWLRSDPLFFGVLTRALQPASAHLVGPLAEVAKGRKQELADKRYEAASVLAVYAADRPETLVDLLAEADERPFGLLLTKVQAHGKRGSALLVAEVKGPAQARPEPSTPAADALASRQANAAAALLRLGREEAVWPLLRHRPDPTARTLLTLRLASHGVEASVLIARLKAEPDASARRALLSALGEYDDRALPEEARAGLVPVLLRWYREDPDPGIHGTIDWLLRQSQDGAQPRALDWGQAEALAAIDAELRGQAVPEGRLWSVNGQGDTLVHIPGPVEFVMGSPASEPGRSAREAQHRVRIGRSFAVASKKVTVWQWQEFRKAYPKALVIRELKQFSPEGECPIVGVTWYEAAQYCRWLSEQEGIPEEQMCYPALGVIEKSKDGVTPLRLPADYLSRTGYRLPTEAEWEYAARSGSVASHWYGGGGEELLTVHAWWQKNAADRSWPVGQKRPNDFGLFDMHGNTWDWCQDRYQDYPAVSDGFTADEEDNTGITDKQIRLLRGGSFNLHASGVRSAYRINNRPSDRNYAVGLRVARTL